jgi:hypothetical protein
MYVCKFASQYLYENLKTGFGNNTFDGCKTFDEAFAELFEPYPNNPGWSDASLAEDSSAMQHAADFLYDHMDEVVVVN